MRRVQRFAAAAAALLLGLGVLAAGGAAQVGDGKVVLAEGERNQLIAHDTKVIQEALAKDTLDPKTTRKLKATALMVAAYAQGALDTPRAKEMAALRDTALKLLQALENKNVDEAKKLAPALAPALTPAAKADPGAPVPLHKLLPLELLMRQFSGERVGGYKMEAELEELAESKEALTAAQLEKLLPLANKVVVIGRLARAYDPPKTEEAQQTRKNWERFAEQMETAAAAVATAARARQADAARAAVVRLNDTCTACHKVFRD
jgi:hypothetical protein